MAKITINSEGDKAAAAQQGSAYSKPLECENNGIKAKPKILSSILQHVGDTPLVRLSKLEEEYGLDCELLGKCEFFNPGGSTKDRVALRMFEDAEASGRIKPGDTIIEPTSGNTGLGLALCAAIKGYRCIIVMPEKMSNEKIDTLKALGAEIIRTPTEAAFDDPESHMEVSYRLERELPNAHILNQYTNPCNPLAHYDTTAEELLQQCDGQIDMVVAGTGTGGTITGLARKIKEHCPNVKIVGADPVGSILAQPAELNVSAGSYQVEGIGYDFIPQSLDRSLVDQWYKTSDGPSFRLAREAARKEGILCGGSSGSALSVAVQAAKELGPGQRCVVILPDGIRNYMSKFVRDDWLRLHGFDEASQSEHVDPFNGAVVSSLPLAAAVTINNKETCSAAVNVMKTQGVASIAVVDDDEKVVGLMTQGRLLAYIARANGGDLVSKAMMKVNPAKQAEAATLETPLAHAEIVVEANEACPVIGPDGKVLHMIGRLDLLNYLVNKENKN